MKKKKEKACKELLKTKKGYCLAHNIITLALNILSLGGIFAAIGLDVMSNASPETVLTTAGISMGVGVLGIGSSLLLENKKKTASQELIAKVSAIQKPDENGESKELFNCISQEKNENEYMI